MGHKVIMIDFVDWLNLREGEGFFFWSFSPTQGVYCILHVY